MASQDINKILSEFVETRDWEKFHSSENLAKSIAIEAAELLELFQWDNSALDTAIIDELADVLTYCFLLAKKLEVSPEEIILDKLKKTEEKYPVSKSKGKSTKYDRL